jgi:ABC-type glucose/galactose transport system permease subunit
MADKKPTEELEDYAGGWITERKGTGIPAFLKLTYIVVTLGVLVYFVLYINGDTSSDTPRAALVRQFDSFTTPANGFMYFVIALVAIYAIITVLFAFRKAH